MSDIVTELRYLSNRLNTVTGQMAMRKGADEIERLRAERDELRREVCSLFVGNQLGAMRFYAERRGWDCFGVTKCQPPAAQTDETSQEDGA